MNEEVASKSLHLAVRSFKVTANVLYKALRIYSQKQNQRSLEKIKNQVVEKERKKQEKRQARKEKRNAPKRGLQTVKQLIGQGQGVESMEITDEGVKDFKKIANKYGVDFAIVRDKNSDPPVYTIFFKAKDVDAITAVLKEYSAKQMKKQQHAEKEKPSILEKLNIFKEMVKNTPRKDKEKRKEMER